MAVSIPREVFTLGAVQLNTQPLARLQGELMAKKAAKEEAIDKYLLELQGKIPKDQVRAIDRPIFQQKVQNWISEGISAKGKPDAQQKVLEGFQGLLADANESKAAGERQQKIAELKLQGKIDEDDFPIIDRMSQSIYDQNFYKNPVVRQPFTIEDFSANIPAWDLSKRKQFIDFAQGGMKPAGRANEREEYDPKSMSTVKTYDQIFTPQQIKDASQRAIVALSDKSGLKTYRSILEEGAQQVPSEQFSTLARAYSMINPDDVMDTPLKVAQADVMLTMMGARQEGEKTVIDYRKRASLRGMGGGGGGSSQINLFDYDVLGKYEPQQKVVVVAGVEPEERVGSTIDVVYVKDIPSEDLELITNNGAVSPITEKGGQYFKIRPDGNWEGAKGQLIDRSSVARSNLDKISLSEEKRLKQGLIPKVTTPKAPSTPKPTTKNDPLGILQD
jgi:hypothetical protein